MSPHDEARLRRAIRGKLLGRRNMSPELSPLARRKSTDVWEHLITSICADVGRLAEIEAAERADQIERELAAEMMATPERAA